MDKLTSMTPTESVNHSKVYGDYNSPPPNFTEITDVEFSHSMFFVYTPDKMEFRQIVPNRLPWNGERYYLSVRLFYFHDGSGVGISSVYGQKIRYFRFFVCDHKDSELLESRMCYRKTRCRKCGYVNEVDSSD